MSSPAKHCPGCGSTRLSSPYRIARQPVILNYRFTTRAAALGLKRRDILLTQCRRCGLVFNSTFAPALIPYDEKYENRQCFSPAFQQHLGDLAENLIGRYSLRGKRILEIGCGKGDFLRLLCERAGAKGVGYDTSYEGPARRGAVRFFSSYAGPADIREPFDAIICRHVVEHIGPIGAFLRELHAIASACGNPVLIIETPAFEWIAENACFWDIFYEHCNYFPRPTLAHLAQLAGFTVARHRAVFGGQYQQLDLRLAARPRTAPPPRTTLHLAAFARGAEKSAAGFLRALASLPGRRRWAIWGAGAKGVCLINRLGRNRPEFVIDSNPAKQGCFIPGSAVPIVAPDSPRIAALDAIFIANPKYTPEISAVLAQLGFTGEVRPL